jgi:signal transduction histidine kinase
MSIRLRLTLLYTAILATALIVSGVALYAIQSQLTLDIVKTNLMRQADGFAHGPMRPPRGGYEPPDDTLPGRWTQLRSLDGTVIGRTLDLSDTTLPLTPEALYTVLEGKSVFETAELDGEPLLIYSIPITREGTDAMAQVAAPIADRAQTLSNLRLILIVGGSIVILAAFALSWIVGGTALEPIQRITNTARTIGAEHDFSRRVTHTGPNDEVGQLATTFNSMLTEMETAYHQLEESLDSQRRFVADASHELRTPLTTLRGNVELLRHQPPMPAEERAEVLADTQAELDRMIRLVHQLLTLARADAGQALRREPIALTPLLEDVCRMAKQLAPERNLVCEAVPALTVLGDPDALKQVLLILFDNAAKHTAPHATITLGAASRDGQVEISVHDTGEGIPPEILPHVFELSR